MDARKRIPTVTLTLEASHNFHVKLVNQPALSYFCLHCDSKAIQNGDVPLLSGSNSPTTLSGLSPSSNFSTFQTIFSPLFLFRLFLPFLFFVSWEKCENTIACCNWGSIQSNNLQPMAAIRLLPFWTFRLWMFLRQGGWELIYRCIWRWWLRLTQLEPNWNPATSLNIPPVATHPNKVLKKTRSN